MLEEICLQDFSISLLTDLIDLDAQWNTVDFLELPDVSYSRFRIGFASSERCVNMALRLRADVFSQELGHTTDEVRQTGLDRDRYDAQMHHLLLVEKGSNEVIGTYRLQTVRQALAAEGIYSAQEFQLDDFSSYFDQAVECGRACIVPRYRKATSLLALWSGLSTYTKLTKSRWLFGCCSVNSVALDDGWRVMKTLREQGYLHPDLLLPPTESCACGKPDREFQPDVGDAMKLPKLFASYMKLGAKVISLPAIDREFGTIDFLIVADISKVNIASLGVG